MQEPVTGFDKLKRLAALAHHLVLSGLICLILFCSGCLGGKKPPLAQLPRDLPPAWSALTTAKDLPLTRDLLSLIDHPVLERLIKEALQNNPDLKATALRLKAAGYLLGIPRSRRLPQVSAGFSFSRDNQQVKLLSGRRKAEDSFNPSFSLKWELDLWGRLADDHQAAKYSLLSRKEQYLQAKDALAARVIQTWLRMASARRGIAIQKQRLENLRRIEGVLVQRFRDGLGSLDELSTAKSRSELARADLSAERSSLEQITRRLEVLLGRYPKGAINAGTQLPQVKIPPVSIPATALINRPDIKAALDAVDSARSEAKSADKALLPQVQLSAELARQAANLGGIGGADTLWSIMGALFQPIFLGGRLRGEARASEARAEASLQDLRQVVLQALKEVEDALVQERELGAQARALRNSLKESNKSSRFHERRYRQGLTGIQSYLIAKEQEMEINVRLNQVEALRLINRVQLALASGASIDREPAGASKVKQ